MQSIEALISLMFFVSICAYMLSCVAEHPALDDSLYRYQLTNDVWRVLYLRGDFKGLRLESNDPVRERLDSDLGEIEAQTGLCAYLGGIRDTSCPGQKTLARVGSINRIVFIDGSPENLTLMVGKADG